MGDAAWKWAAILLAGVVLGGTTGGFVSATNAQGLSEDRVKEIVQEQTPDEQVDMNADRLLRIERDVTALRIAVARIETRLTGRRPR